MGRKIFPVKYKISLITSGFILLVILFFGGYQYYHFSTMVKEGYNHDKIMLQEKIVDSLNAMDLTYSVLEKSLEERMRSASSEVSAAYDSAGTLDNLDLTKLQGSIKGMDISMVNEKFVIAKTSNKENLFLDYKLWPEIETNLKIVKFNNHFSTDRSKLTVMSSEIRKFSYEPTHDGKYLIEISVDMSKYADIVNNKDFNTIANNLAASNSMLTSVTLFSSSGKAYGKKDSDGNTLWVDNDSVKYFQQAIKSRKIVEYTLNSNGRTLNYQYIPNGALGSTESKFLNVIEVVYNSDELQSQLYYYRMFVVVFVIGSIILFALIGLLLSRYITKPVDRFVETIKAIDGGNMDSRTGIHSNDEFSIMSNSFDKMVDNIQDLLNERNQHIDELNGKNQEIAYQKDEINALYEETVAMNEELENLLNEVRNNYFTTVQALANAVEANDQYTRGHCERVTEYSLKLGQALNLFSMEMQTLRFAGILHDIGKLGVPTHVLNKHGALTDEEFALIKKHPEIGYNILKDVEFLEQISQVVYQHHERYDGRGYPNGIKGEEINKLSRIITVADAFDAMTSSRPYRYEPLTTEKAVEQLIINKGKQFDAEMVDAFIELLANE